MYTTSSNAMEIQAIVLDQLHVHVTQELVRQITEIYELFYDSQEQQSSSTSNSSNIGSSKLTSISSKDDLLSTSQTTGITMDDIFLGGSPNVARNTVAGDLASSQTSSSPSQAPDKIASESRNSDMHSHFQYIIRNKTETKIMYCQTHTSDMKVMDVGEETSYSFSNPYQPKLLEIALHGGWTKTAAFPLDALGNEVFILAFTFFKY